MASKESDKERAVYQLQKKYFKTLNNFLGCQRNGLLNELETKTMESEVKRAKREWDLAQ